MNIRQSQLIPRNPIWRCGRLAIAVLHLTTLMLCSGGITGCTDQQKQARSLLNEAVERQEEDNHKDAVQLLNRAVALDANLAEALFARGVSEIALEDYTSAEKNIRGALNSRADWPYAWWTLATLHRLQNQPEKALEALTCALELEPDFTDARFDRACLYESTDRLEEALIDLDLVIQWKPEHKRALLRRAGIARMTGRISEADRDLSRLIKLDRHRERAWFERAIVRKAAGS
jgi:tetratricopeptide (TPR) repeat protein